MYGSLKQSTINKLTQYYRAAIVSNVPDVPKMKNAILGTLYHCTSTDSKPNHIRCPSGESSWCFYSKALDKKGDPQAS